MKYHPARRMRKQNISRHNDITSEVHVIFQYSSMEVYRPRTLPPDSWASNSPYHPKHEHEQPPVIHEKDIRKSLQMEAVVEMYLPRELLKMR